MEELLLWHFDYCGSCVFAILPWIHGSAFLFLQVVSIHDERACAPDHRTRHGRNRGASTSFLPPFLLWHAYCVCSFVCLIALPIIALFHLPLDPSLATASATAAASTAAPLPAAAAMARTSGRATFTFSRCTVQEAVIQSLHQLS